MVPVGLANIAPTVEDSAKPYSTHSEHSAGICIEHHRSHVRSTVKFRSALNPKELLFAVLFEEDGLSIEIQM